MQHIDTAVIGAGFAGLAAAMDIKAGGRDVMIFDKRSEPGGKAYSFQLGAYRFDAGPSLFTLASYFDDLFRRSGADFRDYVNIIPLDPITRYFFPDGSRMNSRPMPGFLEETERIAPSDLQGMREYMSHVKRIYHISENLFLRNPLNHWRKGGPLQAVKNLTRLTGIDVFRTMHRANSSFVKDPRLVQLLDRFATYNGSNPYKAPAALNCIAWVEHGMDCYALRDGIASIPKAMERRLGEMGAEFSYSAELTGVDNSQGDLRRGGPYVLSFADGSRVTADRIVSDVDILHWYEDILAMPGLKAAKRYRREPSSSSAVVFFWGVKHNFEELGLHNIFFSSDYEREFDEIHAQGRLPEDPTVYVNIGSKFTPEDAPAGGENWFVMVNAPYHTSGRDWERDAAELKGRVISRLSRDLGKDISPLIREERILTPDRIQEETGSYRGSLYGISSNTMTAAFRRHPNVSPYFPGMYHCGGSVHPGGGMPLAVSSGRIAASLLLADLAEA
ncbi:phytoene desaturase family protein [Salinispira pacifica]|uniref:Phytoene desaturase, neurosporene or lycopene producing/ 4,4'-diapolycopene oxidase n=1 Tax=Salinispira pacifica TaxID=1307761 RepID=V5WK32_9SPIO|nr:phytoene desaturase family protein [Salinispira pacifica]AHC15526.1 Phytoene desaturase, neurosporene or lycopene producing/ 4,4'-diapolycopene oxidase [Salinispira pacifica]